MSSLAKKIEPALTIKNVRFTESLLVVTFADGREVVVPIDKYPFLKEASRESRESCEIFGEGSCIHWITLDEFLTAEDILMGWPSVTKR